MSAEPNSSKHSTCLLRDMMAEPSALVIWEALSVDRRSLQAPQPGPRCSWCRFTAPVDHAWRSHRLHVACAQTMHNEYVVTARAMGQGNMTAKEDYTAPVITVRLPRETLKYRTEVLQRMAEGAGPFAAARW